MKKRLILNIPEELDDDLTDIMHKRYTNKNVLIRQILLEYVNAAKEKTTQA